MDRTAPATSRQLWALFCATKEDHRGKGLTYGEASDLLEAANKDRKTAKDWLKIYNEALKAGFAGMNSCTPVGMVVGEHENMMDDKSPLKKAWIVPDGPCGFAWVTIPFNTKENRQFINALKKKKIVGDYHCPISKDSYAGGFKYWVSEGRQSIQLKEAFAYQFARVLAENKIKCYVGSRLD